MQTNELDFELPTELIAQTPTDKRGESRLLHYQRQGGAIAHHTFTDLPTLLRKGDLLVFNDARVIPARFVLRKETGGLVDGLFLSQEGPGRWRVMLRNVGPAAARKRLVFEEGGVVASVLKQEEGGEYLIEVDDPRAAVEILDSIGRMPLPPYIHRSRQHDDRDVVDRERYQTVYSKQPGAIAAPTAGLHFTAETLRELEAKGVAKCFVTLHVGVGTFKPVTTDDLSKHPMHSEAYSIDSAAAESLNRTKQEKRRIIAVGTTAARVLESQTDNAAFVARSSETSIFIYPPYHWKHVDALITNFHLPRSTLIALVAAMVGLEELRRIYQTAIDQRYRFFSYGDAMFIE
jgi:S-adenosylmethionine:tRNA ribosyltransferase-isomerase